MSERTYHGATSRSLIGMSSPCSASSRFSLSLSEWSFIMSVVRVFAHGAMSRRIDTSWGGPIELFLIPASAQRLVYQRLWYVLSYLWDGLYKRTFAEWCCRHMGYYFRLYMHHPTDSRGALAGMRNNSMGPPYGGPIRRPIAP